MDILEDYCRYLETHSNSLLTRFFGCYSITMYGDTTHFVVMENVFHNARTCPRARTCVLVSVDESSISCCQMHCTSVMT